MVSMVVALLQFVCSPAWLIVSSLMLLLWLWTNRNLFLFVNVATHQPSHRVSCPVQSGKFLVTEWCCECVPRIIHCRKFTFVRWFHPPFIKKTYTCEPKIQLKDNVPKTQSAWRILLSFLFTRTSRTSTHTYVKTYHIQNEKHFAKH